MSAMPLSLPNAGVFPDTYLVELPQLSEIQVSGEERLKYLQGQLTNDLGKQTPGKVMRACHCDAKGKAWAIYQTIVLADSLILLGDSQAIEKSLPELKKYAVFSKVNWQANELRWFGGAGAVFESYLQALSQPLPQEHLSYTQPEGLLVIRYDFPSVRYLVGANESNATHLTDAMQGHHHSSTLWQALDIQAGLPSLASATSNEYVPQMLNMQALDAISFTKGCYIGQETVARTRYLGKNKRAAYILRCSHSIQLEAGETLEVQLEENWRRGGTVLSCATLSEETWLMAVLPNDTQQGALLRSKAHPDAIFEVQPLPYSLEN